MLKLLNPQTSYTVYRADGGTYVNGVYQEAYTPISIKANIQPDNDKKTQLQGDYGLSQSDNDGWIKIFSKVELFSTQTNPKGKPDIILYNGKYYEIKEHGDWNKTEFSNNVRHYKSRAQLKENFTP